MSPQSTHLSNVSYWTMSKKTRCFVSHLIDPFLHEMMNGRELMVFVLAYAEWHWQKSLVIMIKTLSLFIRSHLLTFATSLSYELPQRLLVRLWIVKSNPYKWRTSLLDKLKNKNKCYFYFAVLIRTRGVAAYTVTVVLRCHYWDPLDNECST